MISNSKYINVTRYHSRKYSRWDVVGDDGALVEDTKLEDIKIEIYTSQDTEDTPRTFATKSCLGMMMKMII